MPSMTKEQLEHFDHFGFVTAEGVLDPEDVIDPVIDEYASVLDSLADELYDDGKISSTYEDLEFGERVTQIYAESDEVHNGYFDFSLPQGGITEDTPFWAGPAVFKRVDRAQPVGRGGIVYRPGDLLESGAACPHQSARRPRAARRDGPREIRDYALASGLRRGQPRR